MKEKDQHSAPSAALPETVPPAKSVATHKAQDATLSANDLGQGIDRPGFDLGGSSGDTHAGTGLGLGNDAFDTAGERRLPGRRLDNNLTIPRWGGPEPRGTTASDKKTGDARTPATPEPKKPR